VDCVLTYVNLAQVDLACDITIFLLDQQQPNIIQLNLVQLLPEPYRAEVFLDLNLTVHAG